MTVTRETLDGVKKFARSFQYVIDLADNLESVEALKQLEAEHKAQLADTDKKLSGAIDVLGKTNASIKAAEATLADAVNATAMAKTQAVETTNAARREATQVIKDAHQEAQTEFDMRVADAKKSQAEVEKLIAGLRGEVSRTEDLLASKKSDLIAVQGQIDKAKAHIAGILKGV